MTAFTHAHFYKWTWYSAVFDRSVYFCIIRRFEICLDCQTPVPSGRIKYCPKKEGKNAPGLPGVHQDMGVTAIMDQKTFDEEQKHLTLVYGKLTETCADLTKRMEELNATAEADKKDILSNLRLDTADDEVRYETYGEIETWNRYIDDYHFIRGNFFICGLGREDSLSGLPGQDRTSRPLMVNIQWSVRKRTCSHLLPRRLFHAEGCPKAFRSGRSLPGWQRIPDRKT